jgi:CRP/FNR family transcriptional regulator, cyclic AMP receptor protein
MVLESGRVKVTRIEVAGHETLLSIRDPEDIVGELAVIDDGPRLATVTALEPVRAVVIASSVFRAHVRNSPGVAMALLEVVTRRFRETTIKRSQFAASDTIGRLAARIVELAERYGSDRDGVIEIELALSQEELGAWTGASRAGVAKALQTLRELGWIETHRRRIVVCQLESLRKRAA